MDSSKRPDFAPLAEHYPGERHARPDQFSWFETICKYSWGMPAKKILSISPLPLAKYSQVRYFGRNIWSSGVSLKILQNAVQTRWPCVNKTQQLKVITKSLDCGYNLKLEMGAGRQELIRWFMMHLLNKVAPLVKRARGNKKIFFGPAY